MEAAAPVVFRLSSLQKTLWSNPALRQGCVYAVASVEGELDPQKLKDAFTQVAERHESLRTFFQLQPGFTFPFQVVRETPEFSWEAGGQQTDAAALLNPAAWPAANPLEGPAFGVKLAEVAPGRHLLALRALALCCDHESLVRMIAEVARHYAGETVEEGVQYADFSEWHNETLAAPGEEAEAARAFWAAQAPPALAPLARVGTGAPARFVFSLPGDPAEAALLGAWQALLGRLTGQEAFAVDVLKPGRPLEDLDLSVGLFARPFPASVTLAEGQTLASIETAAAGSLEEMERSQAYFTEGVPNPVAFEYLKLPNPVQAGGLTFTLTHLEPLRWPATLTLSALTSGAVSEFALLYDDAAYSPATLARLAGYLTRMLAAEPSAAVAGLDLLEPAEREQELHGWNQTTVEFGETRCFPELFAAQAALTPGLPALRFEQTMLTYAELNARANQAAHWLRAAGVQPGAAVGLCLERSAEMIVALLAILKAGAAYVPLLPDLPGTRLEHQIAEAKIGVIVSAEPLLSRLQSFAGQVLCLDRDRAALDAHAATELPFTATPDDLAYILYTSGSTGTPKGVAVRHGNLSNYILGIVRLLELELLSPAAGLTFATVSTLGADLGNTALFPPLVTGGCLSVIGYEEAIDGGLFARRQDVCPADVLKITPSNLAALLASAPAAAVLPRRFLLVGGEACRWELVDTVASAGVCTMFNHYGPTETTIGCLVNKLSGGNSLRTTAFAPLGLPLPNQVVYVLDSQMQPQPAGVAGELCVGGAGVTAGYLGRADETARRFVVNPFAPGMLYRTGDLGRRLPAGEIEFLGRIDDQVKIRGYRVELGEIEAVLHAHAAVQQAQVLFTQDPAGDHLTAYVAASPAPPVSALQDHLRARLPDYMVPRDLVVLEQMPLSPNGKIDRRALAALKPGATRPQTDLLAPRTELEAQLVAIWAETLRVERVGIRDNFFDLGGHSLLATQIISRVRTGLGANVSIRMLFEAPTVESLAAAIETTRVPAATDGEGDLDDLLAELEGLSDAEAEEILGGSQKGGE